TTFARQTKKSLHRHYICSTNQKVAPPILILLDEPKSCSNDTNLARQTIKLLHRRYICSTNHKITPSTLILLDKPKSCSIDATFARRTRNLLAHPTNSPQMSVLFYNTIKI